MKSSINLKKNWRNLRNRIITLGVSVGIIDGITEGWLVGLVGLWLGNWEGDISGDFDGIDEGMIIGASVKITSKILSIWPKETIKRKRAKRPPPCSSRSVCSLKTLKNFKVSFTLFSYLSCVFCALSAVPCWVRLECSSCFDCWISIRRQPWS